jgi:MOSC domain-containing protein YiiM
MVNVYGMSGSVLSVNVAEVREIPRGDPRMLKRFAAARRPGAYLRIAEEGELAAGDAVEVVERPGHDLTIAAFASAYLEDRAALPRLLEVPAVSEVWRDWVRERAA